MLVAVRPQSDSSLELEPVYKQDRYYIHKYNTVNGTCIAYIEDVSMIEYIKSILSNECLTNLNNGKRIEIEYDTTEYIKLCSNGNYF